MILFYNRGIKRAAKNKRWDGVHAEMTNKAIAAGEPVFCEKPLATTKADCAEIVRIEIIDNWAERFPKAYDNELQHWINHLRGH